MPKTHTQMVYDLDMTVTWGDCDAAGISYYAKNFDWFTNGRMSLLDHYGFSYIDVFHEQGILLVCLKAHSDYKKMLKPLEQITVRTTLSELSRTRITFTYQLLKSNGQVAADGYTSHAFVDKVGKPFNLEKRYSDLWKQLFNRWSQG